MRAARVSPTSICLYILECCEVVCASAARVAGSGGGEGEAATLHSLASEGYPAQAQVCFLVGRVKLLGATRMIDVTTLRKNGEEGFTVKLNSVPVGTWDGALILLPPLDNDQSDANNAE